MYTDIYTEPHGRLGLLHNSYTILFYNLRDMRVILLKYQSVFRTLKEAAKCTFPISKHFKLPL